MNNQIKDSLNATSKEIEGKNFRDHENINEEKSEDDNWENYSDYDSHEEQAYQGDKIKKEQITNIIGSQNKPLATTTERKRNFDSNKNQKYGYGEKNERRVQGGKFEKREKYGKYENYNTYEKLDKRKEYEKSQKFEKYEKFDKTENYNNYDNYGKYNQHQNYNNYNDYQQYDKYEKYDNLDSYDNYNSYDKNEKYEKYPNNSKKMNSNVNYYSEKNKYYQNNYSKNYNNYNDNYYNYNSNISKKNSGNLQKQDIIIPPMNMNKTEEKQEDNNYDNFSKFEHKTKRGSFKKQDNYYTSGNNKGNKRIETGEDSINSSTKTNPSYSFKNEDPDKTFEAKTEKVYNMNNNYARKTPEFIREGEKPNEKYYDKNKNAGYKDSYDRSGNKSNWKDSEFKQNVTKYSKDSKKDYHHKQDLKKNIEESNYDGLKKPVFINSSISNLNESTKTTLKDTDTTSNKLPITGLLNVPLNKIDEKILNSKEQYVQQQMAIQNLNTSSKNIPDNSNEKAPNETPKLIQKPETKEVKVQHINEKFSEKKEVNIINSKPTVINYNLNTVPIDNLSTNVFQSSNNTQTANYHTPTQYNNYYNLNKNVNCFKNLQNLSNVNNYYPNVSQTNIIPSNLNPQYLIPSSFNNPLANYYANNRPTMNLLQNYQAPNPILNDYENTQVADDFDLKHFTEKLNLNAQVYVPKKNIENKFDNCSIVYPESVKHYYSTAPKTQTSNFVTYENKFD